MKKKSKENAREIIGILEFAFCWAETKDGWEYWHDVQQRLDRIASSKNRRGLV